MINVQDLDGQGGHYLARLQCKSHSFIVASDTRYFLRMHRMGLSFHLSSAAQLMRQCSRNLFQSSFGTMKGGLPKSVIVMDNASFHHTKKIAQMCTDSGVKLDHLPSYSLDLNPIKEFSAKFKGFVKRNQGYFENDPSQGFDSFLEQCIKVVGANKERARGYFRHTGLSIKKI